MMVLGVLFKSRSQSMSSEKAKEVKVVKLVAILGLNIARYFVMVTSQPCINGVTYTTEIR